MLLRHIGERRLLREIREKFSATSNDRDSGIIVGIGDDAAVMAPLKGNLLCTTDMMNEGIHFDLSFTGPFQLGFKLVSVNVSDVMAMGGSAKYLFLNIALKEDAEETFFWELYEGIGAAAAHYGVRLAGGDLCAARNDTVLSATVLGTGDDVITRGKALVGDRIYVTGTVGDSACGLEIGKRLSRQSREMVRQWRFQDADRTPESPPLSSMEWRMARPLLERHLMPVARDSRQYIHYATSMIDVSDGLFIDLCRICDESNVGARIYLDRLPVSKEMKGAAEAMGLDALVFATSGGEDYELLFTSSSLPAEAAQQDCRVTCIGEVVETDRIVVDAAGREFPLKPEGYEHFESP